MRGVRATFLLIDLRVRLIQEQHFSGYPTNALMMGDFNADCNYFKAAEYSSVSLATNSNFTWLIDSSADTTVSVRTKLAVLYFSYITPSPLLMVSSSHYANTYYTASRDPHSTLNKTRVKFAHTNGKSKIFQNIPKFSQLHKFCPGPMLIQKSKFCPIVHDQGMPKPCPIISFFKTCS